MSGKCPYFFGAPGCSAYPDSSPPPGCNVFPGCRGLAAKHFRLSGAALQLNKSIPVFCNKKAGVDTPAEKQLFAMERVTIV